MRPGWLTPKQKCFQFMPEMRQVHVLSWVRWQAVPHMWACGDPRNCCASVERCMSWQRLNVAYTAISVRQKLYVISYRYRPIPVCDPLATGAPAPPTWRGVLLSTEWGDCSPCTCTCDGNMHDVISWFIDHWVGQTGWTNIILEQSALTILSPHARTHRFRNDINQPKQSPTTIDIGTHWHCMWCLL